MYCPRCGQEYQEVATVCTDCGVPLTVEPPEIAPEPEPEWLELETVLETSDPALLAVARSLLEAMGVPCVSQGEILQEFLGMGRLPAGTNLVTGPVLLQVPRDRSAEARKLLAATNAAAFEAPAGEPSRE